MNKSRRIGALLAASAAAMGMATVGLASPAAAYDSGPRPVAHWLRAVQANTDSWTAVAWRTDRRICDVEVQVDGGRRVDIDYPGRRDYTSFSRDDSLRPGRTDFTAFQVEPRFNRGGVAVLRATIEYDYCGPRARTHRSSSWVYLPIVRTGDWGNRQQGGNWGGHDQCGQCAQGNPGGQGNQGHQGNPGGQGHEGNPGGQGHQGNPGGQGNQSGQNSPGSAPGQSTPGNQPAPTQSASPSPSATRPHGTGPGNNTPGGGYGGPSATKS